MVRKGGRAEEAHKKRRAGGAVWLLGWGISPGVECGVGLPAPLAPVALAELPPEGLPAAPAPEAPEDRQGRPPEDAVHHPEHAAHEHRRHPERQKHLGLKNVK